MTGIDMLSTTGRSRLTFSSRLAAAGVVLDSVSLAMVTPGTRSHLLAATSSSRPGPPETPGGERPEAGVSLEAAHNSGSLFEPWIALRDLCDFAADARGPDEDTR